MSKESGHIGADTTVEGTIRFEKSLWVDGSIEGSVQTDGELVIGPQGTVKGQVRAGAVRIAGAVEANVFAESLVVVEATGRVVGSISSPRIQIGGGAEIHGEIETTK